MSRTKKSLPDISMIIKNNPKVDVATLNENLRLLRELKKNGLNIGPNYNLGSPYSRPYQRASGGPEKI